MYLCGFKEVETGFTRFITEHSYGVNRGLGFLRFITRMIMLIRVQQGFGFIRRMKETFLAF